MLLLLSEFLSEYRDLQLADAAYYFAVLAGLTVLIGLSGQISLGHGALMAVGAYSAALLIANEHWPLLPALVMSVIVTALVGVLVGAAASRLRGPYLAGATLAFAVGLPGLAYQYPATFGGANGIATNPPAVPSALGSTSRSSDGRHGSRAPAPRSWHSRCTTSSTAASGARGVPFATTRSLPPCLDCASRVCRQSPLS